MAGLKKTTQHTTAMHWALFLSAVFFIWAVCSLPAWLAGWPARSVDGWMAKKARLKNPAQPQFEPEQKETKRIDSVQILYRNKVILLWAAVSSC